jgi:hypothetical protein
MQRLDPARGDRPIAGAVHARVPLALDVVVDRPGAAGGQIAPDAGPEDGGERRAARVGDEHRRDAGEQEQASFYEGRKIFDFAVAILMFRIRRFI